MGGFVDLVLGFDCGYFGCCGVRWCVCLWYLMLGFGFWFGWLVF